MYFGLKWEIPISSSQKSKDQILTQPRLQGHTLGKQFNTFGPQCLHLYIIDNNNLFHGWKYADSESIL